MFYYDLGEYRVTVTQKRILDDIVKVESKSVNTAGVQKRVIS